MDKPDNPVLTKYIAQLERDRATLLEALEACAAPGSMMRMELVRKARAAISQAKGEK